VLITLFVISSALLLASCSLSRAGPKSNADIPNPASVYCEEHGGTVDLRQDASGGVAGICVFEDGSECDEWAYFRCECKPSGTQSAGSTPGAGTELTSDGWRIYRNEALGYTFQYPAEAEIITADDALQSLIISGPGMGDETWVISHPSDRQEYRPAAGVDLFQWLTDHTLVGEKRLPDLQIAGTTAIHFRHERSPQSYADDRYYFATDGQLYMVLIGHGDVEDWELNDRFLSSLQFGEASSNTSAPTPIPTAVPFGASDYQGFWTYTHSRPAFSIMLPEDWVVEEITTGDPLMNGHLLSLYPRLQGQGVESLLIRMTFRRVGEEARLWPTGVGEGEFASQGTLDVAGQPTRRMYLICPTGEVQSIWYQGGENQPNIQRGDLEFGFIFTFTGFYCDGDHSLGGKDQRVGEMIIASLKVP
jgi:putative hemolysin